jgi:hypothetical protein
MDLKRESSSESRVHEELLRAHLETGFNMAHVAELALEAEQPADFKRAVAEARNAVSEVKRLVPSVAAALAQGYRTEVELLEFELHDLEIRGS